jgi:hypothetical protein
LPQPQQTFGQPFTWYGATFSMSQSRLNDEADDGNDQGDGECRRDVEFRRLVATYPKYCVQLPHGFLLECAAARRCRYCDLRTSISGQRRPKAMFVRAMIMHFGSTHIHQTNGRRAHTFVLTE